MRSVLVPTLFLLLAATPAGAQETVDGFEPAVDTSSEPTTDIEPAVDTSAAADEPVGNVSEAEPVVVTDVRRRATTGGVMDEMDLGRTEITGNQELPKVLYIVPWQKANPGDLMGRPVNTLLDDVLAPIDREEFIRQVDYHNDLYGDGEE